MILAIVLPILGYLLGSVSLSRVIAHAKGIELTGSTGARNIANLTGVGWGITSGVFDFAKGLAPPLVGRLLGVNEWAIAIAGLAAIAGHIWPLYYGFKGGRGLNTITGASALLLPRELPIVFALAIVVGYAARHSKSARVPVDPVAIGAAGALIVMILLALWFGEGKPVIAYSIGAAILPMISGFSDMVAFFVKLVKGE